MPMTDQDRSALARSVFEAYVSGDRARIESALADDFTFISPLDNRIDRETYFRRCWPNHERISGFTFIRVVPDGDRVFVIYEGEAEAGRRFRNTEILTLRDGKVSQAEVYFGWSIPHEAPEGGYLDPEKQAGRGSLRSIFAHLTCSSLAASIPWFAKLLDRPPDAHPMAGLVEWHDGNAGLQLFENGEQAGRGTITLIVDDLEAEHKRLRAGGLEPGAIEPVTAASLFQLHDPDGNRVVMAEPKKETTR